MAAKRSKSGAPPAAPGSRPSFSDHTLRIRALNDALRRRGIGGRLMLTAGVTALPANRQASLFAQIRSFDDFTPENDPYGEHDFGRIDDGGERFFWKIDYYDRHLSGHTPDPADPEQTKRVLTIMLADEY